MFFGCDKLILFVFDFGKGHNNIGIKFGYCSLFLIFELHK
jgi:hypothetical protein